jgi:hypothetical protein
MEKLSTNSHSGRSKNRHAKYRQEAIQFISKMTCFRKHISVVSASNKAKAEKLDNSRSQSSMKRVKQFPINPNLEKDIGTVFNE